ncbi:VOC family protein [Celeribacter baekdonensis]|jgi:lactoylglutathione lyase|uniref:Bleomycin resistance family protein n=1 Tax=Celeribacter baekdonensis TaxID=875171 RepID=A0A2R4LZM4_9RHOB|nr:VOC family protein [Celeribacter baekdonensis]AVW90375.1 bleomycin resistance family protein [Celeribacter baekdonensis]
MTSSKSNALVLGRIAATLPVQDVEKAYKSYNSVFGFEKTFENGDPVGFMILKRDSAELHLTLQKDHRHPTFNVAHILVSNADEACRRCQEHGFRIIKKLQDKDYGLRAFVFSDDDGNRIDVGEII